MGHISRHRQRRHAAHQRSSWAGPDLPVDNYTERLPHTEPSYQPGMTQVVVYADGPAVARLQDRWTWPYAPANIQRQVFNGWDGNQLPSAFKEPWGAGVNPFWYAPTQQVPHNSLQYKGTFGEQLSQMESQDILRNITAAWRNVRG